MNKIKIYFLLYISLFVFSCKNPQNESKEVIDNNNIKTEQTVLKDETLNLSDDSFGKTIGLKGRVQKLDAFFKPQAIEMLIKNDLLVIVSPWSNKMIKVFSLPDFILVQSLGIMGNGPGEFNYPNLVPTNEKDKICYIYDSPVEKLYYIKNDFSMFQCNFKFPRGKLSSSTLRQIHVLSNRNMLYVGMSAKGKKIYGFKPDSVTPETEIFDLALDKKYNNWAAYIGSFGVNKKKDRMVYAYNYFREIKFLNLKGTIEKKLIFDYKKTKAGNAVAMLAPTNITYYWKMSQTSKNIYFSYSGKTPIDWVNLKKKGGDFINIEQYNWNGEPLNKFKLDHAGYFCIDEKRNKLYLIATNAEEPFYVYDLPKK